MRQISPDKKRTYVYSKTQGRLKPNASTFLKCTENSCQFED